MSAYEKTEPKYTKILRDTLLEIAQEWDEADVPKADAECVLKRHAQMARSALEKADDPKTDLASDG